MRPESFAVLQQMVRSSSGILLEPGKEYLVQARLGSLARREGLVSVDDLVHRLRLDPTGALSTRVIEALVTTETSFFRDVHPFETLKGNVLPDLMRRRQASRSLYLWSAACASGQEPYSLAMLLRELIPDLGGWNIRVLASDLSGEMVERAREGSYSQLEINRGMPTRLLVKYFRRDGVRWRVVDEVRKMVDFRKINLAEPLPPLPQMDLVFLRNVLIYLDETAKREALDRVVGQLRSDGYLVVGGAETLIGFDQNLERLRFDLTSCYRPRQPQGEKSHGAR